MTLATRPDYERGGVGTALCCWGIQKAISSKLEAVTLFASPLAKPLYMRLGFIEVGIVHIQVKGEEEFLEMPGMTLELEGRNRSEFPLPRTFIFNQGSLGEERRACLID
jgi:predicted N-acetyltransferase YhbS